MNKSKKTLIKVMLIYALVFLLALAAAMYVLSAFLKEYEMSRPDLVAQNSIAALNQSDADMLTEHCLNELDLSITPKEQCQNIMFELMKAAKLVRSPQESSASEKVYKLKGEQGIIGRLVLRETDKSSFGFPIYETAVEDIDFGAYTNSQEFVIPDNWNVRCNGNIVDDKYYVDELEYSFLEEFYDSDEFTLPKMKTYKSGLYMGDAAFEVVDSNGKIMESLEEENFADNCPEKEKEAVKTVAQNFVDAYVTYSSNANRNIVGNFNRLKQYMKEDCNLQKRLKAAQGGLGWASSKSDELQEIEYHRIMNLGDGMYYCELTYTVDTRGTQGHVITDNNLKIIFVTEEDSLLAIAMTSY